MIGVIADPEDRCVVSEFFELFKTPWEFFQTGRKYDVLLGTSSLESDEHAAKLVVAYSTSQQAIPAGIQTGTASEEISFGSLTYGEFHLPIYCGYTVFSENGSEILIEKGSGHSALRFTQRGEATIANIGYDLFAEIGFLLSHGQPVVNAGVPALELHISLLRDLIAAQGVTLCEIPPVPVGYQFIACLTHDVDHPLIRNHGLDHTILGFLYRATVGSILDVFRGRRSVWAALRNLAAVVKLPLVHLGLARDIWGEFDRYPQLEKGRPSTFFVIPFKNSPGLKASGPAPSWRASSYGAADIAAQIQNLISAGCEIGAHGIDAWRDSSAGRLEIEEVRKVARGGNIGVRMHWLYFCPESHEILEKAGVDFDSTVGYNETIGYRAGTAQVYKPLGTRHLLELPLHVMDTALFYPSHLNLTSQDASARVEEIIENAIRFGGCVTVNWHDRSILPERCWDEFYTKLLDELEERGAWFGTAADTVSWFRKRRSARFESTNGESDPAHIQVSSAVADGLPDLELRVLKGLQAHGLSCNV